MRVQQRLIAARSERQDFAKFKPLIDDHGSIASGFILPANCVLAVSSSSVLNAVSPMISIGAKVISSPPSAANVRRRIGYFELGRLVQPAVGAVGTISLYVVDSFGRLHQIA